MEVVLHFLIPLTCHLYFLLQLIELELAWFQNLDFTLDDPLHSSSGDHYVELYHKNKTSGMARWEIGGDCPKLVQFLSHCIKRLFKKVYITAQGLQPYLIMIG